MRPSKVRSPSPAKTARSQATSVAASATRPATEMDSGSRGSSQIEPGGADERVDCFYEHSPLAVIEWSLADLSVSRWSDAATRLFGWRADDALGKGADELKLVHPEDSPAAGAKMADLAGGKCRRNVSKHRNLRRNGSVVFCEWYNSVVGAATGAGSIVSIVLEVAEVRSIDSERPADIAASALGFTTIDREWRYTEVSEQTARAIGKDRKYILGRSVWEIFPDASDAFRSACEKAWAQQIPVTFDHFLPALGRWYEIFLYPFADRLSIQGHDITDRKRAEQARRESELRLRTELENTPEGYAIFDAERRIEYINSVNLKYTNYKREEVLGKRDEELWPDELTRPYLPYLKRAYETGQPQSLELDQIAVSGDRFTKLINFVPIKDAEGNVRQVVGATYDLTERKRFERALLDADRRKNEFLGLLSHELRNPLTPIRYSLFILDRARPASEQARRAKAIIDRQVDHLARIVDDLLDMTRITQGKIKLQRSLIDLGALVQRTIEDYGSLFSGGEVELEVDVTDERLIIDGDSARIAQIVGNLLQNAAKFTPGKGRVSVTVKRDEAGRTAIICVRDTGVGISVDVLPRLFQPFEQAAETLDRSRGGLGLGLALVKALVEMHGGEVVARSQGIGTGAEFMITFPLAVGGTTNPGRGQKSSRSPSRRVLIIEDNIDSARSLGEVLRVAKHEVEIAYNGLEGIDKARRFRPEIVFCDIGLPGMDGYRVAEAFRSDQQLRSAYLVALTGYALPEDRSKARAAGFDEHVAKPPGLAKLHEVLADAPVRN